MSASAKDCTQSPLARKLLRFRPRMPDMKAILSAKEVAIFLNLAEGTVYRLANKGEIPGSRIGNQWRFRRETIEKLLNEVFEGPKEAPHED